MKRLVLLALVLAGCQRETPAAPERFGFAKTSISLPTDAATLPGAAGEIVAANCTACHSTEMIATQPPMPAEKWAATVAKMHDVYHAPIAPVEQPRIVAALVELQAGRAR